MLVKIPSPAFESLRYPSEWKLYGKESSLIPWDLSPMVAKESTLFHAKPNFAFQLNKAFVPFLRAINRKELFFYDGVLISKNPNDAFYNKDFLITNRELTQCDFLCLMKKLRLSRSNTFSPLYAIVEVNYRVENNQNIYNAIDGDFNTPWIVDPKANYGNRFVWLKITMPEKITVYGVRITANKTEELWQGNNARLEWSSNNKDWHTAAKLDLSKRTRQTAFTPILFSFNQPISAKYFRLWIDDQNFSSLGELELIDVPVDEVKTVSTLSFKERMTSKKISVPLGNKKNENVDSGQVDIDLHGSKEFNAVFINISNADYDGIMKAFFELQVSVDKKAWRTILQKSMYSLMNEQLHFLEKSVHGKFARLKFTNFHYYPPEVGAGRRKIDIAQMSFLLMPPFFIERKIIPDPEHLGFEDHGTIKSLYSDNPNVVLLKTHADENAMLIRAENYDRNWKVYIDDKETELQAYGPNLQLISLPEGEHYVRMEYKSLFDTLVWMHVIFFILIWLFFSVVLWWSNFASEGSSTR